MTSAGPTQTQPTGPAVPTTLLARNSFLNLVGLGLPLVVGVLVMPAVAAGLGVQRFGVLALVWAAFAFLQLLDVGLGRATTKFAAEAIAARDTKALREVAWVAALMQLGISVAGGVALVLAAAALTDFLDVPAALHDETRRSFVILGAVTPALIVANTFRGLLEAAQRFDVVNRVRAPMSTANFVLPLVGVWLDWSLPTIVAAIALTRVIALAVYAAECARMWPELRTRPRFDRNRLIALATFGGWISVSGVVSPLLVYVDRFVIGAIAGVAAVAFYSAPHEIVTRLSIVPAALVATLFPAFSGIAGSAESAGALGRGSVDRLLVGATKYLLILLGPMLIAIGVLAHDVLALWLGADFATHGAVALTLLAAGMMVNALAYAPQALLQANGRADLTAKFHLLELPIHALVLWLAVDAWGIAGAAAAWSFRVALDTALLYGGALRLGLASRGAFATMRLPATIASLTLLTVLCALATLVIDAIWLRIGAVALLTLGWTAWAWRSALDDAERARARASLSRLNG